MAICPAQRDNTECDKALQTKNDKVCQVCKAPKAENACAYERKGLNNPPIKWVRSTPELEPALKNLKYQLAGICTFMQQIKIDCDMNNQPMFSTCQLRCELSNFVYEFSECIKACDVLNKRLNKPDIKTENKLKEIKEASDKLAQVTKDWTKFQAQWPTTGSDLSGIAL